MSNTVDVLNEQNDRTREMIERCLSWPLHRIAGFFVPYTLYLCTLSLLVVFSVPFTSTFVNAEMRKVVTPRLSVYEQYDDNIYLTPANEISDWLTIIAPGINLDLETSRTRLFFDYEAGFTLYKDNTDKDTTRHRFTVDWEQDLARNFRLNLNDSFRISEDPFFESDGVIQDIDTSRRRSNRNDGEVSLTYDFGKEDRIVGGYRNRLYDDRSDTNNDSDGQEVFAELETWFSQKWGMEIVPRYQEGNFEIRDDDFDQYGIGGTVNYRWAPSRKAYVRYDFLEHQYKDAPTTTQRIDYQVHNPSLGLVFGLGARTDLTLEGGHYIQDFDTGDDLDGPSYLASLSTSTQRANFRIEGSGGYDQDYFSSQNRGSMEFHQGLLSVDYQLLEPLNLFASGSYRKEDYSSVDELVRDSNDDVWRVSGGVSYTFLRWLTFSATGTHWERDSDDPTRVFDDNRVTFRLTGAYPIRF